MGSFAFKCLLIVRTSISPKCNAFVCLLLICSFSFFFCTTIVFAQPDSSQAAIDSVKQAFDTSKNADKLDKAYRLRFKADSLVKIGQVKKAVANANQAALMHLGMRQNRLYVETYYVIAKELVRANRHDEALALIKRAYLVADKKLDDNDPLFADLYDTQASIHRLRGNYKEAVDAHLKSISIHSKNHGGNSEAVGRGFFNLGRSYFADNDLQNAMLYNQKALNIQLQLYRENHPNVAATYNNIGLINRELGNFEESIRSYQTAIKIRSDLVEMENPILADLHTSLAISYLKAGRHEDALVSAQKANDILLLFFEENHSGLYQNYKTIGEVYLKTQRPELAKDFYESALKNRLMDLTPGHPEVAEAYKNLGDCALKNKASDQALKYYAQALQSLQAGEGIGESENLKSISKSRTEQCGLGHVHSLPLLFLVQKAQVNTHHSIFKGSQNKDDLKVAIQIALESLTTIDAINRSYNIHHYHHFKLEEALGFFEQVMDLCFQFYTLSENDAQAQQWAFEAAMNIVELQQYTVWRFHDKDAPVVGVNNVSAHKIGRERETSILLDLYRFEVLEELQREEYADTIYLKDRFARIDSMEKERAKLMREFNTDQPDYYRLYHDCEGRRLDVEKVRNFLGGQVESGALVYFFLGKRNAYSLAMNGEAFQMEQLRSVRDVEQYVIDYHKWMTSGTAITEHDAKVNGEAIKLSRKLYAELIAPIQQILNEKQSLRIIPTGILTNLPFEALLTENLPLNAHHSLENAPYLLKQYEISYSDGVFFALHDREYDQSDRDGGIGIWSSTYDRDMLGLSQNQLIATLATSMHAELKKSAQEATLVGDYSGEVFSDRNASKYSFKQKSSDKGIIHLALHALLNENRATESSILFNSEEGLVYNELVNNEVKTLSLKAYLVLMSAVNKQRPDTQKAYAKLLMNRSWGTAGCQNVISSFWRTEDAALTQLLEDFYSNINQGESLARALHLSKLNLLKNKQYAHPYYWSALQFYGDPDYRPKQRPWLLVGLGLLALLVLGGGGITWWMRKT